MPIKQAALFHALDETTDVHTFIDSKAHIRLAQNLMIKLAVIRLNSTPLTLTWCFTPGEGTGLPL